MTNYASQNHAIILISFYLFVFIALTILIFNGNNVYNINKNNKKNFLQKIKKGIHDHDEKLDTNNDDDDDDNNNNNNNNNNDNIEIDRIKMDAFVDSFFPKVFNINSLWDYLINQCKESHLLFILLNDPNIIKTKMIKNEKIDKYDHLYKRSIIALIILSMISINACLFSILLKESHLNDIYNYNSRTYNNLLIIIIIIIIISFPIIVGLEILSNYILCIPSVIDRNRSSGEISSENKSRNRRRSVYNNKRKIDIENNIFEKNISILSSSSLRLTCEKILDSHHVIPLIWDLLEAREYRQRKTKKRLNLDIDIDDFLNLDIDSNIERRYPSITSITMPIITTSTKNNSKKNNYIKNNNNNNNESEGKTQYDNKNHSMKISIITNKITKLLESTQKNDLEPYLLDFRSQILKNIFLFSDFRSIIESILCTDTKIKEFIHHLLEFETMFVLQFKRYKEEIQQQVDKEKEKDKEEQEILYVIKPRKGDLTRSLSLHKMEQERKLRRNQIKYSNWNSIFRNKIENEIKDNIEVENNFYVNFNDEWSLLSSSSSSYLGHSNIAKRFIESYILGHQYLINNSYKSELDSINNDEIGKEIIHSFIFDMIGYNTLYGKCFNLIKDKNYKMYYNIGNNWRYLIINLLIIFNILLIWLCYINGINQVYSLQLLWLIATCIKCLFDIIICPILKWIFFYISIPDIMKYDFYEIKLVLRMIAQKLLNKKPIYHFKSYSSTDYFCISTILAKHYCDLIESKIVLMHRTIENIPLNYQKRYNTLFNIKNCYQQNNNNMMNNNNNNNNSTFYMIFYIEKLLLFRTNNYFIQEISFSLLIGLILVIYLTILLISLWSFLLFIIIILLWFIISYYKSSLILLKMADNNFNNKIQSILPLTTNMMEKVDITSSNFNINSNMNDQSIIKKEIVKSHFKPRRLSINSSYHSSSDDSDISSDDESHISLPSDNDESFSDNSSMIDINLDVDTDVDVDVDIEMDIDSDVCSWNSFESWAQNNEKNNQYNGLNSNNMKREEIEQEVEQEEQIEFINKIENEN